MFNLIIYGVISFWKIITRIFTEKRRDKKWIERLGWGILTILAIDQAWDSCHGFIPWLQIVVYGGMNAGILKIFYRCTFLEALLWNWLYDIGYTLLKMLFSIIRGVYLNQGATYVNVIGGRILEENVLCFFQLCVILVLYFKCLDKIELLLKTLVKTRKMKIITLITEVIILESIHKMMEFGAVQYKTVDVALYILIIFCLLTAFLLYIVYTLYIHSREEQKSLVVQREILIRETEVITEHCRRDAKKLHDLKHTWIYLQNCLEEKDYGEALKCVCKHLNEVRMLQRQAWTGIAEIDLLLNYKYQKMKEQGIHFSKDIDVYSLPVTRENFMIILGNLLDNAIEAAEKYEGAESRIHLLIKNINEMFIIRIGNTCMEKSPEYGGKRWKTTKNDSIHHGWGIENVRQIVECSGGKLDFRREKDWFEISILI